MTRTSARAKKSKQDVNNKKEEAKQKLDENQTASEGAGTGESTDKENDSTNYDVEKITHTRIFKGKRQYLVRWKGYTEDSDTWENESVLQSCKEILEAFKKENLTEPNSDDESVLQSFKKENLTEPNSDDEVADEKAEEKERTKSKKKAKNVKKTTKKSAKSSKQKIKNEDSEIGTEEEPDDEGTKGKNKETEESDLDSKEKRNKTGTKGKKRKSAKKTESSKAKKVKKVEGDDESVTDAKDYEVEKIVEVHTKRDGSHEFLIRWKGYRPSDDTWEPEAHLDCKELIEKFMGKVDKAKDLTKKDLREHTETKRFVPLSNRRVTQRNNGLRPCYQESYED